METLGRAVRRLRGWMGVPRRRFADLDGLPVVTLVDTAVASRNVGDQIIMDAVERHLAPILEGAFVHRVASHEVFRSTSRGLIDASRAAIVGGTNLIGADMLLHRNWRVSPVDALARRRFVLMGVGWKLRTDRVDRASAWMLRRLLAPDGLHAVRDGYTAGQLSALGITNVVDTGCPTIWDLDGEHCAAIPAGPAAEAVLVLNRLFDPPGFARRLAAHCATRYDTVHFWPQNPDDHRYAGELGGLVTPVAPGLEAYDRLLRDRPVDYVGTRLHGGIRALQAGRRTLIVELDHRAAGMAASANLPTVPHDDWERLMARLAGPTPTDVRLDRAAIRRFKDGVAAVVHGGP